MKNMTEFGMLINGECKRLKITRKELAQRCKIGSSIMCKYCRGTATPSPKTVIKIETELNLPEGSLEKTIERSDEPVRVGYVPSKTELKILSVWNRGELTPEEVSKKTGYCMKTVNKYLPMGKDG